jgi:EAL domain-containing protein (putative c-di-GMP-specific phosphodiesterase class I)
VNLQSNRICAVEALLRWKHPERGTVAPGEFLPIAEETGIIVSIGEWVLHHACAAATAWPDRISIAVNVSPIQFKSGRLVEQVKSAIALSGIDPKRLELEITETVLLANTDSTLQTLHRVRDLGVRISMDDFGTGFSSLNYLRSFPFDKIKIDRSFVHDSAANDESRAIIKALIGLGHSLGISTTAEGVENEQQLSFVRDQGCDEVQGYLFSPPLPIKAVSDLISCMEPKSGKRGTAWPKANSAG